MRNRFQIGEFGPPPTERLWVAALIVLVLILGICYCVAHPPPAAGAEPDTRPMLWIYTASWCGPCQQLHEAVTEHGALKDFRVVWLDIDKEHIVVKRGIPQIAYWKKNGKAACFEGWGAGAEAKFLAQWQRDTAAKPAANRSRLRL